MPKPRRIRKRPTTDSSRNLPTTGVKNGSAIRPKSLFRPESSLTVAVDRKERANMQTRASQRENELPKLGIDGIYFVLFTDEDLRKQGVVRITSVGSSGPTTVMDPRMGVLEDNILCSTCHKDNFSCPGHYGYIDLVRKFYQPPFISMVLAVLKSVCNCCGRLLMPKDSMEQEGYYRYQGMDRLRMLASESESLSCSDQQCRNNPKFIPRMSKDEYEIYFKTIDVGGEARMDIEQVSNIFKNIPPEDVTAMGFEHGGHPSNLIKETFPVIPPCARPYLIQNGQLYNDHLTNMYIEIVKANQELRTEKDPNVQNALYKKIIGTIRTIIDNTGNEFGNKNQPFKKKSIKERIQGKRELIRGAIMGKRVNFSARTPIGPDPSLRFGQIRVPREWAPILTVRETVNYSNIEYIRELGEQGKISFITRNSGKMSGVRLSYSEKRLQDIQEGDVVERHLRNGDIVVGNRQPTLHKYGFMAMEVVLGDSGTIGLHLSCTTPFNADFDGDEMNIHVLQTLQARVEARTVMHVKHCLTSTASGRPTMGLVQDALIGGNLLTEPGVIVREDVFMNAITMITDNDGGLGTLRKRLDKYNMNPRSGRALFSALFPPDFYYEGAKGVLILDGVLVQGALSKTHLGTSNGSIIHVIWKDYGLERTSDFLTDAPWVIEHWLTEHGFTIGITSCMPTDVSHRQKIMEQVTKAKLEIDSLGPTPKDTLAAETHERKIMAILDNVKTIAHDVVAKSLPQDSELLIATTRAEAKGTAFNLGQVSGILGQMLIAGGIRIPQSITNKSRSSVYFPPSVDPVTGEDIPEGLDPEARGYCTHSFFEGLTPAEMVFNMAGGRTGLMDTAIKTGETGFLHRKLVKALEDITIHEDGSVRNAAGVILDFSYGNDGFNVAHLEKVNIKGQRVSTFINLKRIANRINARNGYVTSEYKPIKILLLGPKGVGKSHSVNTMGLGKTEIFEPKSEIEITNLRLEGQHFQLWEIPGGDMSHDYEWDDYVPGIEHVYIYRSSSMDNINRYTAFAENHKLAFTVLDPPHDLERALLSLLGWKPKIIEKRKMLDDRAGIPVSARKEARVHSAPRSVSEPRVLESSPPPSPPTLLRSPKQIRKTKTRTTRATRKVRKPRASLKDYLAE